MYAWKKSKNRAFYVFVFVFFSLFLMIYVTKFFFDNQSVRKIKIIEKYATYFSNHNIFHEKENHRIQNSADTNVTFIKCDFSKKIKKKTRIFHS